MVDTRGNLLEVAVTAAHLSETSGATLVLSTLERLILVRLVKRWADQGYQGEWEAWV
jgi:hypothetical protein